MMILCYSLYELVPKLLFLLGKTRVWTKNWKKEQKIEKKAKSRVQGLKCKYSKLVMNFESIIGDC